MAVNLLIPTALRAFTDGKSELSLEGGTAGEVVEALAAAYPDIRRHLYGDDGALRSFVNIYVGEVNVKNAGGLDAPLRECETLMLVPAIAGGTEGGRLGRLPKIPAESARRALPEAAL
jgi:molybdopterin converting factor small subunit